VSYLNPVRIHFAGKFRADVSTVNNDPAHFDNSNFVRPDDQLPGNSGGWWQPAGTGAWRIDRCTVTSAVLDGAPVADPVVGIEIRDSGDRVSAKLVDLDPDQQMVSTIFGMEVRLVDPVRKRVLMRGRFEPVAFYDIWGRALASAGDAAYSASFQSVLTDVEWGDLAGSQLLQALRAASLPGLLSIKFNTDSYSMRGAERGYGRMVGAIGPQLTGDPRHFTPGRFLAPVQPQLSQAPIGYVGCWVDSANGKVIADFGNALHTYYDGLADVGPLHLIAAYQTPRGDTDALDLGALQGYVAPGWYENTAGIQAFPADRSLTADELQLIAASPLCVAAPIAMPPSFTPLAAEAPDGVFMRPDLFVFRMEPDTSQDVAVMALKFGQPLTGAAITTSVDTSGPVVNPQPGPVALTVSNAASIETDQDGWATVTLAATDPGLPRVADGKPGDGVDGQVYSVSVGVANAASAGTAFYPDSCFVSVLLFSKVEVPATVGWDDVLPIFQQYSNLYPRPHGADRYVPYQGRPPLHPVVNLADETQVQGFAWMIAKALRLPIDHPNHMPVTRDLSAGRRQLLLGYVDAALEAASLATETASALPTAPAQAPVRDFAAARSAASAPRGEGAQEPAEPLGGKTAARMRTAQRKAAATAASVKS
jgi:hypothetical protein